VEIGQIAVFGIIFIIVLSVPPAFAAVGDVEASHNVDSIISATAHFCSIGLATDGTDLWLNGCLDPLLYCVDAITGAACGTIDPGIPENPNAMAFDAARNGLWIGTQSGVGVDGFGCGSVGVPIYFYDFDDSSTTLEFTIPVGTVNPFTGLPVLHPDGTVCFVDGLAYNKADPITGVDTIYFSDDVSMSVTLFDVTGTIIGGFDASTIDGALAPQSGLAVGGSNLYLGNNGGGEVYRASLPALGPLGLFSAIDDRVEDLECDPDSFADEVMWVRSTPQGAPGDNIITAYEIEPATCGEGGEPPIIPPPNGAVGGIFEPIDATAVLVAGVYSSTYWLIPIVFSAVGIGIILIRKRN
jgi:hypothetical protein